MAERQDDRQLTAAGTSVVERPGNGGPANRRDSEGIRRDIENTRASLDEKLGALQEKVHAVQTKAKQTFDVQYQIDQHPWAMVGASVAVGFVAGAMSAGPPAQHAAPMYGWHSETGSPTRPIAAAVPAPPQRRRVRTPRNDLFETLKLAVGAALTDMAKQAIHKYSPALGEQLDKVWKERGLTSMSAASALMGTGRRDDVSPGASGTQELGHRA